MDCQLWFGGRGVFAALVAIVAFGVLVYAAGYMRADPDRPRFFGTVLLFLAAIYSVKFTHGAGTIVCPWPNDLQVPCDGCSVIIKSRSTVTKVIPISKLGAVGRTLWGPLGTKPPSPVES